MEILARRNALKFMALATATADVAWTDHWFNPRFIVSNEALEMIEAEGSNLKNSIEFSGFDKLPTVKGTVPSPNSKAFAETLLQVGYIDGGENYMYATSRFVRQKGLLVSCVYKEIAGQFKGVASYISKPEIRIGYDFLQNNHGSLIVDQILWHEFYHLVQVARNPEERALMFVADGSTALIPTALAYMGTQRLFNYFGCRRDLLKMIGGGIAALIAEQVSITTLRPSESQAYAEGARVTKEGSMKNRINTLFEN